MTFFCVECLERLPAQTQRCPRCGAAQTSERRDYTAKLRKALMHPIAETRRRAIYLLGEMRIEQTVGELTEILDREPDPFLAEEAAEALAKIGGNDALAALLRAAHHRCFLVRACAIEALVRAGRPWKDIAQRIAQCDSSAMVRESARGEDRSSPDDRKCT